LSETADAAINHPASLQDRLAAKARHATGSKTNLRSDFFTGDGVYMDREAIGGRAIC